MLWGCVQDTRLCEKKFKVTNHKMEDYKGTHLYNRGHILTVMMINRWFNRVEEDVSGLTFEEWDPTQNVDTVTCDYDH